VVTRRQFLKQLGLGIAVGSTGLQVTSRPIFSLPYQAFSETMVTIAFLADSHLPNADCNTAPAKHLATAVAEINAQDPPVDLVFFGGDLTDDGDTEALWLGREILASLNAPLWLLPGERDSLAASQPLWQELFGDDNFSFTYQGVHFCGFNTVAPNPATGSGLFQITPQQQRWLVQKLLHISPEAPLLLISHAPLYRLFQPWQWWTEDAESLYDLLVTWKNVYLFHGHVHQNITLYLQNLTFQGMRSTAWPLPDVRVGIKSQPAPGGAGRIGCGWMLLTIDGTGAGKIKDQVWKI
jgi:3',5'-cyclic-AMP phosphodiesterase